MSVPLRDRAALLGRLAETWFRRPVGPNRLVMAVTERCNLRCRMCRIWAETPSGSPLRPDEMAQALRPLPGLVWLDVTGGEIFLRDDLEAVFDAILGATPALRVLHFPTNGSFPERAEALTRRVLSRRPEIELLITVSLDGPPAVHDAMRGRDGSFSYAMATLRALRALPGAAVYVGTTVTSDNVDALPELEDVLRAELPGFHPRDWHWNWVQRSGHYFHNEEVAGISSTDLSVLERHLARRGLPRDMVGLAEFGFFLHLLAHLRGERVGIPCQALRSTAFLSATGEVYPCHVWDRPLGNVRETSLPALWRSPELRAVRADVAAGRCPGCFATCEAYPAMAGAPVATSLATLRRLPGFLFRALRS